MMTKPSYKLINLDYLELMTEGDISMKKTMLEMLFKELPSEIEKMIQFFREKNWEKLRAVSHKMKSTLAFVGNDTLTNTNKEVEQRLKNNDDLEPLPDLLDTLEELCPLVLQELEQEFSSL